MHICVYFYTRMYACMHVCTHVYMYVCMHVCMHVWMYGRSQTYGQWCFCLYMHLYVCKYVKIQVTHMFQSNLHTRPYAHAHVHTCTCAYTSHPVLLKVWKSSVRGGESEAMWTLSRSSHRSSSRTSESTCSSARWPICNMHTGVYATLYSSSFLVRFLVFSGWYFPTPFPFLGSNSHCFFNISFGFLNPKNILSL